MEEKKVLYAYTVSRNEDGSIDVSNVELEGVEPITTDKIYEDIENVSKLIQLKRYSDAAFAAAYNGTAKFFQDIEARNRAAQQQPEQK